MKLLTWFRHALLLALAVPSHAATAPALDSLLQPYAGISVRGVDTSTLTGKVMCGYQVWFNYEGDGAGRGVQHWTKRRGPLGPGNAKIDL